jgi:hypothetical protein
MERWVRMRYKVFHGVWPDGYRDHEVHGLSVVGVG